VEALSLLQWSFDGLLGLSLLWLAWQALVCTDLFKAVVLFIAFGLLMALTWVRLAAPDIALAEAAIGAGLTGALLLSALARSRVIQANGESLLNVPLAARKLQFRWLVAIILLIVAAGLGYAVLGLPPEAAGLSTEVAANLTLSGVGNPVTAVLLNFRAYDTLLEMAVLLLALLAVWSLGGLPQREAVTDPVLDSLVRLLIPVLILVSAYLLWVGADAPGGAFQAGSVLSAAGVLLLLAGWRLPLRLAQRPLRFALVAGTGTFIAIAVLTLISTGRLLEYPPAQAGTLILILEAVATISIGVTLAALFQGASPVHKEKQ